MDQKLLCLCVLNNRVYLWRFVGKEIYKIIFKKSINNIKSELSHVYDIHIIC